MNKSDKSELAQAKDLMLFAHENAVRHLKDLCARAAEALLDEIQPPHYPNGQMIDNANPLKQLKIELIRELQRASR